MNSMTAKTATMTFTLDADLIDGWVYTKEDRRFPVFDAQHNKIGDAVISDISTDGVTFGIYLYED